MVSLRGWQSEEPSLASHWTRRPGKFSLETLCLKVLLYKRR